MENKSKETRYSTVKNYPGIRKEIKSGKFIVTKSIRGKRFMKSFSSIREAALWKNSFNPDIKKSTVTNRLISTEKTNGEFTSTTLGDVWRLYYHQHVLGLEKSSQETSASHALIFESENDIPIYKFTREFIDKLINEKKANAVATRSARYNFDRPLKFLKSMFRWYSENYDETFLLPIIKRHFVMGKIKEISQKEKKLSSDELLLFFQALPPFYRDVAMVQFFTAARIQEVAGLQVSSVSVSKKSMLIKDVVVWGRNKKFLELKDHTKNGEIRFCHLTDTLIEIFNRKLSDLSVNCSYVFHENGKPLSYRKIQYVYNKALAECGLNEKFSGSHILRHSMATVTRMITGSIDAAQCVTGHKDQRLVHHYASMPDKAQEDAVKSVDEHFKALVRASSCKQTAEK